MLQPQGLECAPAFEDIPVISVDRAIAHFASGIAGNIDAIRDFYHGLPHEHKRPLSELSLHFSASSLVNHSGERFIMGCFYPGGTASVERSATPELPATSNPTIVMYVGSIIDHNRRVKDEAERFATVELKLSEFLTHELTHYAQLTTKRLASRESLDMVFTDTMRNTKSIVTCAEFIMGLCLDHRWKAAVILGLSGSDILNDSSLPESVKVAAVAAGIVHLLGYKGRKGLIQRDLDAKYYKDYREDPYEIDAREHQTDLGELASISVRGAIDETKLERIRGISNDYLTLFQKRSNWIADKSHLTLSLNAPSEQV